MKNKLILSIEICLISILAISIGTSIAWFSSNDYLQIDSFDLSFKTVDNLLISTNVEGEYKNALNEDDLETVGAYLPVSSMFSENWIGEKKQNPEFMGAYNRYNSFIQNENEENPYVLPNAEVTSGGYFSQELFLKSESDFYATLDLSNDQSYLKSDKTANLELANSLYNKEERAGSVEEIYEKLNSLEKAMRISVLIDYEDTYKYFIYDPYKSGETRFGGVLDSDCLGTYDTKINPVNMQNYEVLYGDVKNRDKIVYSYNENAQLEANPTSFTSGHNANTNVIDLDASINNGVIIANEKSISFSESERIRNNITALEEDYVKDNLILIPLDANKPTRIVVSVYLEGWDTDCVDYNMGASFNCQLSFGLLDRNII